jgi:hypothetical protein
MYVSVKIVGDAAVRRSDEGAAWEGSGTSAGSSTAGLDGLSRDVCFYGRAAEGLAAR